MIAAMGWVERRRRGARTVALSTLAAILLAACGGGGDSGGADATTAAQAPTTLALGSTLPPGVTAVAADDSKVEILRDNLDQELRSTSQGGIHAVLVAFTGKLSLFADQCPAVPRDDRTVTIVYFGGAFVTPDGRPATVAMVSTAEDAATSTTYTAAGGAALDAFSWCRDVPAPGATSTSAPAPAG